jgi:hypothetical protein
MLSAFKKRVPRKTLASRMEHATRHWKRTAQQEASGLVFLTKYCPRNQVNEDFLCECIMWLVWGRREMHTGFWQEKNQK